MPHSLFLGSALATQDRLSQKQPAVKEAILSTVDSTVSSVSESTISTPAAEKRGPRSPLQYATTWARRHFRVVPASDLPSEPKSHAERENRPYEVVRAHLYHGIVDMVISLLGLAVVINSMYVLFLHHKCASLHWLTVCSPRILILSAAVFFERDTGSEDPADLFDAYDLLRETVGKRAYALVCLVLACLPPLTALSHLLQPPPSCSHSRSWPRVRARR